MNVTFLSLLKQVAALHKFPTDPVSVPTWDTPPYNGWAFFFTKRAREGYEAAMWRTATITEQRTADANGVIAFDQAGKTRIGRLAERNAVCTNDPRTADQPFPARFVITSDGIQVDGGASTAFWITYRREAPRFTTEMYVPAPNQYEPGTVVCWPAGANDQLYGNCYELRVDANGAAYWDLQVIPAEMAGWLVESVFADTLMLDGQRERAKEHLDAVAYPELFRAAKANTVQLGNVSKASMVAR